MDLARSFSALLPPGNPPPRLGGGDVIPSERAKARQPALQMEEVEIRATGTEGKLVPVGDGPSVPRTVASAGEGGGNKPLRAAPPSSSAGTRATGGRGGGAVAAAAASAEEDIVAAMVRRHRLSEQQARAVADAAAKNGVVEKVQALVKSPGDYKNPENLSGFLSEWKASGKEGKVQALEDAVARLQKQHKVALEGGGADVVDYTAKEAIQHKRIFGEKEGKLGDVLGEAADQLSGSRGEIPPKGFKKVIDVRFDPRSTHPLKGGDRNAVRAAFPDRDRLKGVDRIFITTNRGTFQFDPPFPLH
jgi:polyhydroxyalkanoate synthesis regulator phasin